MNSSVDLESLADVANYAGLLAGLAGGVAAIAGAVLMVEYGQLGS